MENNKNSVLKIREGGCTPCAQGTSETRGCSTCIHEPICAYCADHLENFSLPDNAGACAMYATERLDAPKLTAACEVRQIASPLADTIEGMLSPDYKERFRAEYIQTKIRYERLKAFNNKIEAAGRTDYKPIEVRVPMPKHDCPDDLLMQQQRVMGEYLHILEVRAIIEEIEL